MPVSFAKNAQLIFYILLSAHSAVTHYFVVNRFWVVWN